MPHGTASYKINLKSNQHVLTLYFQIKRGRGISPPSPKKVNLFTDFVARSHFA